MSESSRRGRWILGAVVVVCAVSAVGFWSFRKPKVSGDTPEDRIKSVLKLADDRPPGYAEALADAARNDPDAAVRRAAVVCLTGLQTPDVRSTVAAAARDDDPNVRRGACRSMMTHEDKETVDRLVQIGRDDADEGVRDMAFVALAANDSPHALVELMEMMEHGATEEIQVAAAAAMVDKLNTHAAPDHGDREEWENMLEGMRMSPIVHAAYEQTGTPLVHDERVKERIIGAHEQCCHGKVLDKPIEQNTPREE